MSRAKPIAWVAYEVLGFSLPNPERLRPMGVRISRAAIKIHDCCCAVDPPERHCDIIRAYARATGNPLPAGSVQGFVTSDGRFVDRAEAAVIAFKAGQIDKPKDELFSEDLW